MNIEQAREKVQEAISANATVLDLISTEDKEKLTSDDMEELVPEILKISSLAILETMGNQLSNVRLLFR